MSAIQRIKDYLHAHFDGHDIETLMTHFETAIEAHVEKAVAEVREEIDNLRDELTGGRPVAVTKPAAKVEEAAQPEATTEATTWSAQ